MMGWVRIEFFGFEWNLSLESFLLIALTVVGAAGYLLWSLFA
jgi:hypothetical protein